MQGHRSQQLQIADCRVRNATPSMDRRIHGGAELIYGHKEAKNHEKGNRKEHKDHKGD